MALVACRNCSSEIAAEISFCPHCGVATPTKVTSKRGSRVLFVILGVVAWVAVGAYFYAPADDAAYDYASDTYTENGGSGRGGIFAETYDLEVISSHCEWSSSDYITTVGQIRNVSAVPLRNVMAVATYTAKGSFVISDDALVDYNPILPGQTSPFKTITRGNPAIDGCRVEFKTLLGGTVRWYERAALVSQAQTLLKDLGLYGGSVDGQFGPGTREALKTFAEKQGRPAPVDVDRALLWELDAAVDKLK